MRYQCDIEGYEDCFIELKQSWTRGEIKRFFNQSGDEWLGLLRSKIETIHLRQANGDVIDTPEKFTNDSVDEVDFVFWRWVQAALQKAIDDLQNLGEENARRWLDGLEKPTTAQDN